MCSVHPAVALDEGTRRPAHDNLLRWALRFGAKIHTNVTVEELPGFGLSITASGPISSTEPIFELPSSLLIDPYTSIQDPVIQHAVHSLHISTGKRVPAPLSIVLKLALERSRGSESLYYSYIASLPTHGQALMHLSLKEACLPALLMLLDGTGICAHTLIGQLTRLRGGMLRAAGIVGQPWCTEDALAWAYAMYSSRAMLVPLPTGAFGKITKVPALFPVADICNHSCTSASRFECGKRFSSSVKAVPSFQYLDMADVPLLDVFAICADLALTDAIMAPAVLPDGAVDALCHPFPVSISLYSGRAAKEGQQVFINYGGKSQEDFVKFYGFVDHDNTCLSIYMKPCIAPGTATQLALCCPAAESAQKYIVLANELPDELLDALHGNPATLLALCAPLPAVATVEGLPVHAVQLIQKYRETLSRLLQQLSQTVDPHIHHDC
jgi:hypothetical protein